MIVLKIMLTLTILSVFLCLAMAVVCSFKDSLSKYFPLFYWAVLISFLGLVGYLFAIGMIKIIIELWS